MTAYSFKFHRVIATVVIGFTFSAVTAQDTFGQSLPQPVTLAAPEMGNMSDMLQSSSTPEMSDAIAPTNRSVTELPASVTSPSGILPSSTGGPFVFEPLAMCGNGCNPRPMIDCTGPDYCGCTKRIYYGTNPCDDDPILPLHPSVNDKITKHWYQHAFNMVTRKKAITEAIK
ncbi:MULTISPECIES: hypothetical protein [Rhodopirellula]|uniref:Secreted protein n=2 Tax=Rhodopirellula TaxID=265488 RepID=M5RZT5_9BACT|nr:MULTISPECIES: hypothetical protein [Rhodopirellula]EMI24731.1 secreted protein [Rhodopirellula europaea SH398]PHQ34988.1 hypothetical protein CEE69_11160 [Rhodopirellula bahusiensis]